ncbi:hypothetical protein PAXRUDRAFT_154947, partial [Paxillus rubicundulus Ve08.2h10]
KYLKWKFNIFPVTLKEFEELCWPGHPGPYLTYILLTTTKATSQLAANLFASSLSTGPSPFPL